MSYDTAPTAPHHGGKIWRKQRKAGRPIGSRPRGRPTIGVRVGLGLRVTPEMKERLEAAAQTNGRSQSQEA